MQHLRSVERVGWVFKLIGYLTAWWLPNPISVVCLSLGQTTRWGIAHHVLHRGYDRVHGVPKRFTSTVFGAGWRRFVDWFDWIHPFGWSYEHNVLHHCHTGEETDPDLLERETAYLQSARIPMFVKYLMLLLILGRYHQ